MDTQRIREEKSEWRQFCETEPSVTLYQQPWYWDATCDHPDDWRVILIKKNGKIEAAFPFVYVRRKFMWFIESPWLVPAAGIWMRKRREDFHSIEADFMYLEEIVNEVVNQLPYFDCFHIGFDSRLWSWQPFYWKGFDASPHYTMVIRPQHTEGINAQLSKSRKKRVHKAQTLYNISVNSLRFEDYWDFFEKSYQDRGKVVSYSKSRFIKLFAAIEAHKASTVRACVTCDNGIVAVNIVLMDNERIYHLFGTQMHSKDKSAKSFLVYDAICQAMQEGKIFDFEGSMIPGVAKFNLSFNPSFETLYYISKKTIKFKACKLFWNAGRRILDIHTKTE